MPPTSSKSPPMKEGSAKKSFVKRPLEDFILPRPLGHKNSASLIYGRKDYKAYVLQSCSKEDLTVPRRRLVDIARDNKHFVSTHLIFPDKEDIYIVSQVADMCLSDIIHCSIPMTEEHVSAILTQVIQALCDISSSNIKYNNLEASRIFISRRGDVQLANFAPALYPQYLKSSENSDCVDIPDLINHILTKKKRMRPESETSRQKLLQIKSRGKELSINPGTSAELVDFLGACDKDDIGLLKNHKFLGVRGGCLSPLVYHAERASYRP